MKTTGLPPALRAAAGYGQIFRLVNMVPRSVISIHVTPDVDVRAAAHDLLETGAVGIDDIGETLYDVIRDEILEELGHAGDELDIRTQRVDTSLGPVFVLRAAHVWSAVAARRAILSQRGSSTI